MSGDAWTTSTLCHVPPVFLVHRHGFAFAVDGTVRCHRSGFGEDFYVWWWLAEFPQWEEETFEVLDVFLDKTTTYIDVGAWVGATVLYGAARCKTVLGLEPDPAAWGMMLKNLELNKGLKNMCAINAALNDTDGPVALGGNGDMGNSETTMLVREPDYLHGVGVQRREPNAPDDIAWRSGTTAWVQGLTIESLREHFPVDDCGLLKIDIEGGEKYVLPALLPWLTTVRPTVYLSLHWKFLTLAEIEEVVGLVSALYPILYNPVTWLPVSATDILGKQLDSFVACTDVLSAEQQERLAQSKRRVVGGQGAERCGPGVDGLPERLCAVRGWGYDLSPGRLCAARL